MKKEEFNNLFQATDSETYKYFYKEERQSLFSRVFGECYGICVIRKQRRPYRDDEDGGLWIEPSTLIEIEKEKTLLVKFLRYILGRD